MYSIMGLPDDGRFRMVAWMDRRFCEQGRMGRNGVTVLMLNVPIADVTHIAAVTPSMVRSWLYRHRDTGSEQFLSHTTDGINDAITIYEPNLRLAAIGDVFRGTAYAGTIGGDELSLSMTRNDQDAFTTLSMLWDTSQARAIQRGRPTRGSSAYEHVVRCFPGSRYLVIPHGTTDILIPRTEIHRQFYAPIPTIAGPGFMYPWPMASERLVRKTDTMQGMFTTDLCSGDHYLIVKDHIPIPHIRLLANFLFHPYGRACANAIYGMALKDATASQRASTPVYYSSRIPYPASVEEPLSIRVHGWYLTDPEQDAARGRRSLFLATRFVSCSEPRSQPQIYYEFEEAFYRPYADETSYDRRRRTRKSQPRRTISMDGMLFSQKQKAMHVENFKDQHARSDGHAQHAALIHADSFFITDAKPMRLQIRPDDEWDIQRNMESSGGDDLESAQSINLIRPTRPSVPQFWNLIQCLIDMVRLCDILEFKVVPPHTQWQVVSCGGIDCWRFLRQWASGLTGPSLYGWPQISGPDVVGNGSNVPSQRVVLILRIVGHRRPVYWMEIEGAADESVTSVLLIGLTSKVYETLQIAMSCIRGCDSRDFHEHLTKRLLDRVTSVHVCTRQVESGAPSAISLTVVLEQLVQAGVTVPREAPTFLQASEDAHMTDANPRWTGASSAEWDPMYV